MTHERQTEYHDLTIYIDCCDSCPWCEDKLIFKSVVDDRYNKYQKVCVKTNTILHNINIIPIECPLPPRYHVSADARKRSLRANRGIEHDGLHRQTDRHMDRTVYETL